MTQAIENRAYAVPPLVRKPRLLDEVRRAIRLNHYSRRTGKSYVFWIRQFILHQGKRQPKI